MKIIKQFKQFLCMIIKKIGIFKILIFNVKSLFVYDEQDKKLYGTSPLLFIEVTHITTAKNTNAEFDVNKFFADFPLNRKLGSGYEVGNIKERKKLNSQRKGFLMLIVQLMLNSVSISRNEHFYTPPYLTRGMNFGITKNCQYLGVRQLNDDDLNQLRNIYPGFCYSKLDKWVRRVKPTTLDEWDRKDIKTVNHTEYGFMPTPK